MGSGGEGGTLGPPGHLGLLWKFLFLRGPSFPQAPGGGWDGRSRGDL